MPTTPRLGVTVSLRPQLATTTVDDVDSLADMPTPFAGTEIRGFAARGSGVLTDDQLVNDSVAELRRDLLVVRRQDTAPDEVLRLWSTLEPALGERREELWPQIAALLPGGPVDAGPVQGEPQLGGE